jgi:hypothetical protein
MSQICGAVVTRERKKMKKENVKPENGINFTLSIRHKNGIRR